jgi:hypothetical protein
MEESMLRLLGLSLCLLASAAGCKVDGSATVTRTEETDVALDSLLKKLPGVFGGGGPHRPKPPPTPIPVDVAITSARLMTATRVNFGVDKTLAGTLGENDQPGFKVGVIGGVLAGNEGQTYVTGILTSTIHRGDQYIVSQAINLNGNMRLTAGQTGLVDGPYIVSVVAVAASSTYDVTFSEAIVPEGFDPDLLIDGDAYTGIGAFSNGNKTVRMTYADPASSGLTWVYGGGGGAEPAVDGYVDEQTGTTIGIITPPSTDTYYVATTGSDLAAGTYAAPFRTPQKGADAAALAVAGSAAGVTVYFREGTYYPLPYPQENFVGVLYRAMMKVSTGGSVTKPITFKNYDNEVVTWDPSSGLDPSAIGPGTDNTAMYGILIGDYVGDYPPNTAADYVTIDGINIDKCGHRGIFIVGSDHVTVQNCEISRCSQYGGEYEGIGFLGVCDSCTIQYNRCWGNGNGIGSFEDDINSATPNGITNCTIKDNICYGNYPPSGQAGNGAGIGFRFPEKCTIQGNICYDNPDGGFNGLGSMCCRYVGNVSIENWNGDGGAGGNMQGFKCGVRGGGGNIVCGNLIALNGDKGLEQTKCLGDLYINNTVTRNGQQGIAFDAITGAAGEVLSINNVTSLNALVNPTLDYKDWKGTDATESDYNLYTIEPIPRAEHAHEHRVDPGFVQPNIPGHTRGSVTQIIHPETLWGGTALTAAQIRTLLAKQFAPTHPFARDTGLAQASIVSLANGATYLNRVKTSLDVGVASGGTTVHAQAPSVYSRVKAYLIADSGYEDLTDYLLDLNGDAIGSTPDIGCCPALVVTSFLRVTPAGTNDAIWTFDNVKSGFGTLPGGITGEGWKGLLIDFGGGYVQPVTYQGLGDAHSVRVSYAGTTAPNLAFRYLTGAVLFTNGDVPDTTAGVLEEYGLEAIPVVTESGSEWRWSFKDEYGAFPILMTGPSAYAALAAAVAGLQLSPSTDVWESPDEPLLTSNGQGGIDLTYATSVTVGRPWRTISPASSLEFENGQVLVNGLTGSTGNRSILVDSVTRSSATRALWTFNTDASFAADFTDVADYAELKVAGESPTGIVSGGQAGDNTVLLTYPSVTVGDGWTIADDVLAFWT